MGLPNPGGIKTKCVGLSYLPEKVVVQKSIGRRTLPKVHFGKAKENIEIHGLLAPKCLSVIDL
jgi:hypothetical protein